MKIADLQAAIDDWRTKLEAQVDAINKQHDSRSVFIVPVPWAMPSSNGEAW